MIESYTVLWSVLLGRRLTDVTNGFRAYRMRLLDDKRINANQAWLDTYGFEYYLHYKALTLDNFGPPPWLAEPIQGGTTACLQHVDAVRFSIDAQLPDGTVGEGILHIDNVVLE